VPRNHNNGLGYVLDNNERNICIKEWERDERLSYFGICWHSYRHSPNPQFGRRSVELQPLVCFANRERHTHLVYFELYVICICVIDNRFTRRTTIENGFSAAQHARLIQPHERDARDARRVVTVSSPALYIGVDVQFVEKTAQVKCRLCLELLGASGEPLASKLLSIITLAGNCSLHSSLHSSIANNRGELPRCFLT